MTIRHTPLQVETLRFMFAFYTANDQLPPIEVIAKQFGLASPNAAHGRVCTLVRHRLLARNVLGKYKFTVAGRAIGSAA